MVYSLLLQFPPRKAVIFVRKNPIASIKIHNLFVNGLLSSVIFSSSLFLSYNFILFTNSTGSRGDEHRRQHVHTDVVIGERKCTDNDGRSFVQPETIALSEQLTAVKRCVLPEKVVQVGIAA